MQTGSSLRLRLLALAVVTILAALVVAGLSLGRVFEHQVLKRVDQELQVRFDELAATFTLDAGGAPSFTRPLTDPRYHQPYSGAYWQVAEAGAPVVTSRSLWDATLDTSDRSHTYGDSGSFEIEGPEGAEVYVLSRPVTIDGRTFDLLVGLDHAEVDASRAAFDRDMMLILGPIALVLVIGAWLQIRQSLSPLRDLDRELKAVHGGARSRLAGRFPREVAPVVGDLNRLLERQEHLVRKARDRAGALAHGHNTPLTNLARAARRLERRGGREADPPAAHRGQPRERGMAGELHGGMVAVRAALPPSRRPRRRAKGLAALLACRAPPRATWPRRGSRTPRSPPTAW